MNFETCNITVLTTPHPWKTNIVDRLLQATQGMSSWTNKYQKMYNSKEIPNFYILFHCQLPILTTD